MNIEKIVDIIFEIQECYEDDNELEYGCLLRSIQNKFINCEDTCKECWKNYIKSLN